MRILCKTFRMSNPKNNIFVSVRHIDIFIMKRGFKITLKVLGVLLLLMIIAGAGGYFYMKKAFIDFEGDFAEKKNLPILTVDGHTFTDRNRNGALDVYEDERQPIDLRVDDALSRMTIEEKIHLLKGSGLASSIGIGKQGEGIPGAVGTIVPTPRLGLPTVYLSDGPAGLRIDSEREGTDHTFYTTAFPIATLLASTWNTELVKEVGATMGKEALEYGIDVILGPGANIHRHPFCGRNFEYYSEDPILTGFLGAAMVNGIESNGVGTSVKHFVANNQETNRNFNDAIISERALREIYLKGFEIIVRESQPWTMMSSYNKVNGTYTSESRHLLTDVLRGEWGFEGLVMTDWFGGNDAASMIRAGNDLLEPGTKKQWKALKNAQQEGDLTMVQINDSVRRILKLIFKSRKMEQYVYENNPDLKAHAETSRQSAAEGVVLLKNNETLPIEESTNLALFGVYSYDFISGGTGSGDVNEAYTISLEEGLTNAGFRVNKLAKSIYASHKKKHKKAFVKPEGFMAMFQPYTPPEVTYTEAQIEQIVSGTDLGIITIGRNSGEGGDRKELNDFLLSEAEKNMIALVCDVYHKSDKQVIIVLNIGGVIETDSWRGYPDAILLGWQGGQESGNAVADVLSGTINPSGKLPMTFPIHLDDHASNKNFPQEGGSLDISYILFSGEKEDNDKVRNIDFTIYQEGIFVGYRHFDKAGLEVSYPFGYGLSYTSFEFGEMELVHENDTISIELDVKNSGQQAGKEVVQVYVTKKDSKVERPLRELKAFTKSRLLEPGEATTLSLQIPVSDLSYWSEEMSDWVLEKGIYEIQAGDSSRDIRQIAKLEL